MPARPARLEVDRAALLSYARVPPDETTASNDPLESVAAHLPMPTTVNGFQQEPLAGKSFLASFSDPHFEGRGEQYFEVFTNRSMYADGWKADAQHTLPWRQDLAPGNWDKDRWELYNLEEDFSEADDLAAEQPEKLAELKAKFDAAAQKYHVYPFDSTTAVRPA
jgi:arylsulfatase A-like enzyme